MLRQAIKLWWRGPGGQVSWPLAAVLFVAVALLLWIAWEITGSIWAQLPILAIDGIVWRALEVLSAKRRPMPPRSAVSYMTVGRLAEFMAVLLVLGAFGLVMTGSDGLFLDLGAGPMFWIYVCMLAPFSGLTNTVAFRVRYSGGFKSAERFSTW